MAVAGEGLHLTIDGAKNKMVDGIDMLNPQMAPPSGRQYMEAGNKMANPSQVMQITKMGG